MAANSTPVKVFEVLSPSASVYCVVCGQDTSCYKSPASNRLSLFKQSKKTSVCLQLESFLNEDLNPSTDFRVLCKNCHRQINRAVAEQEKSKRAFQGIRETKRRDFLRTKFKRCLREDVGPTKPSRTTTGDGEGGGLKKPARKLAFGNENAPVPENVNWIQNIEPEIFSDSCARDEVEIATVSFRCVLVGSHKSEWPFGYKVLLCNLRGGSMSERKIGIL